MAKNGIKVIEGDFKGEGLVVGIVASRFNEFITGKLIEGALDGLVRHGVDEKNISLVWVPGSFEIPAAAKRLADSGAFNAVVCLGAVIRGETPHFDYVAAEVSKGVAQVGLNANIPVIYGVLTTDNVAQAVDRAGTKAGNKGFAAATAAIEMANLYKAMGKK
jgi:6,7-dimethyl-8-ribityllumazine synthase